MQNQSTFQVYNASAGSGKTFTLVKEYLKILLRTSDSNRFQNILAITFTNKAAAEMKARVIRNLQDFSEVEIVQNKTNMFLQIEEETNIQDLLMHQRASKILQSILNNYSAFNITTIDSFTYRLIRSFAFDLGLSLNFDVEMDTKSLLNEAVDTLIAKIGEDKELTKVLIDFSLQKANEDKAWDISYELKEIAAILLNENHLLQVQKIKEKPIAAFVDLKTKLQQKQREIEVAFAEIGAKGLAILNTINVEKNKFSHAGELPNHFYKLNRKELDKLNFEGRLSKNIEENYHFHAAKATIDDKDAIDSILDSLKMLYHESKALYLDLFEEYTLNKLVINSLIPLAVLSKINNALDEIKEERNIRLNAEFNELISKNLREQPAAFIYERLGEKLKHYFIDEMQDTSGLQWQNLIPLIENALSQENASLLLVGDAKQAIYRWRGGEANQFINLSSGDNDTAEGNPFQIEKQQHFLDTNYRSHDEIIDFNNSFFQFLARHLNKQEYHQIYASENQQKRTNKQGGYVELSFIEEKLKAAEKDEIYPEKVLKIINELENDFDKHEICVLTRTRKQGVTIANYLAEHSIDIISSETLLLKNSKKVHFIINLLTYFQQQADKEVKLEVLYFLYEHLKIEVDKHTFFTNFIDDSVHEIANKLASYNLHFDFHGFTKLPFYEGIEEIIRSFKLTQDSDAYLQFFLDEVLQFSQKKDSGVRGFLELWELKKDVWSIVVPQGKDAVQVMTIHKSKGLEFPVVIFPYADIDIYREQNPKVWYPVPENETYKSFDSLLINYNKSLEQTGLVGKKLYQIQRDESELDNFNLLYVTCTRAIEQLYIISEHKKITNEVKSYAHFFTGYLQSLGIYNENLSTYEFGSKKRLSSKETVAADSYMLESFISSPWRDHDINIAVNAQLFWQQDKQESIAFGNLIHNILSKIKTPDDVTDAVRLYYLLGFLQKEDVTKVKKIINKVVTHPELKAYFHQNNTAYNEREILTNDMEVIIPDKFIIDENDDVILIDYKTGKPDKKYHAQLLKYAETLAHLGYKVKKSLLVYIGEDIKIEQV